MALLFFNTVEPEISAIKCFLNIDNGYVKLVSIVLFGSRDSPANRDVLICGVGIFHLISQV